MVRTYNFNLSTLLKYWFVLVIELACEEYGKDKVLSMIKATGNGTDFKYLKDSEKLPIIQQSIG